MPKTAGLAGGLLAFLAFALADGPAGMEQPARLTAAVAVLMAVWWLTETVPVAVTALLPLVFLPALGVMNAAAISAPYASKTNMIAVVVVVAITWFIAVPVFGISLDGAPAWALP